MQEFFVHYNGAACYVKEGSFFRSQGGPTADWGKYWVTVFAEGIEHARTIAEQMVTSGRLESSTILRNRDYDKAHAN